ncbi:protein of unknown function [Streptomyces sp. KY75]|nr:protein of unknown function [Streptomyces sp. KY75]
MPQSASGRHADFRRLRRPEVGVDVGAGDELRLRVERRGGLTDGIGHLGCLDTRAVHIKVDLPLVGDNQAHYKSVFSLRIHRRSVRVGIDFPQTVATLSPVAVHQTQKIPPPLSGDDSHDRSPPSHRTTPHSRRTVNPANVWFDLRENSIENPIRTFSSALHIHAFTPRPDAPGQ